MHGCETFGELPSGLSALAADSPMPGLAFSGRAAAAGIAAEGALTAAELERVMQREREWVDRALAPGPLRLCPYTASSSIAGAGLESQGVQPAPIAYYTSAASDAPALMADFWASVRRMLEGGEETTSSIILSAPAWDNRWLEWRDTIFPLLESGVIAAGLGRTVGIVCFHPAYDVPSPAYLAKHRFGHMHSLATLRRWLREHEPHLESGLSDGDLSTAAAQMRRSPHAVINVLWSRQLEVAEAKRRSSLLYATNIARILAVTKVAGKA